MKATIHKCEYIEDLKMIYTHDYEVDLPESELLDFLQKSVGGLIDIYHHLGRDLVINDEGLLLGLPLNRWAYGQGLRLAGTIVEVHGILD